MMLELGRLGGSAEALVVRRMATDDVLPDRRPKTIQRHFPIKGIKSIALH
jgi:hypothetical protein